MKKGILFLVLITFTLNYANELKFRSADKEIIELLFNGDWVKGDSLIDNELKNLPNHPKYYFLKAYNYFYARFNSPQGNVLSRDTTIKLVEYNAWTSIRKAEELEQNLETNFYVGSAYAFLSRINVMKREYWLAYWNAEKAEDYLNEVLEENPNIYDAKLALGINQYFPARFINGWNGFFAWFGGMSGDIQEGLNLISETAEKGKLFKDEAKFVLAVIYRGQENDLQKSHDYYFDLSTKYPKNTGLINNLYQLKLAIEIDKNGLEILNNSFENLVETYKINGPFVLNTLGYNYLNQEKFDIAETILLKNLSFYPNIANSYDSMGECYMLMGNIPKAIEYYEKALEKIETDTTTNEQFLENLKTNIPGRLEELKSQLST